MMPPISIFVGSSSEARPVAEVVASVLNGTFPCAPWWTVFSPSAFTLEALEAARRKHRFAVFIGRADDILWRRGRVDGVVRDNVTGEFLLFVGANGRDHTYLLLDKQSLPKLPSDLDGLVYETYDAGEFARDPSGAVGRACQSILRRVAEVNESDHQQQREIEAAALSVVTAQHIAELGELAFLLRDIIDAVQRDTLEALLDEIRFAAIKQAAAAKIDDACRTHEQRAASAHVLDEFLRLKEAVARTVSALPFPKDVFTGIDEAKVAYGNSALAAIESLVAAGQRQDWPTVVQLGIGMRDKVSFDALLEQVLGIMDSRLHRLKNSYATWWARSSQALQQRLTEFQRALLRAQTRLALQTRAQRER